MVLAALPADTIRLIKSTQVITTPSSIVKELTENSLDATATTISVKLEKFGFLRLEVRDNGSGIHEDDVALIAKPHFTSKIFSFADLSSLTSYGFRGEALSSLCAVANVSVTTKRKVDPVGHSYIFNHEGEVTSKTPAATPNGTTIVVTNLFKNVPVRHQYYSSSKHCKEELKKVENILLALSVAVPSVHIAFSHDRVNIFQKNAAKDLQGVLMNVFPEICKGFTSRSKVIGDATMDILFPKEERRRNSEYSRSSADRFFTLVNKRPVTFKSIEKIAKAYFNQGHESCHGRYPIGFVSLSVPPDDVDVNLEPNKSKVLLKDERLILEALGEILEDLYGPVEKKKKNNPNTEIPGPGEVTDVHEDITCTLAGVTQLTGKTKTSKTGANDKILWNDEDPFADDFTPSNRKQSDPRNANASTCNGKLGSTVPKRNSLSLQSSRLEVQTSNESISYETAPKVVMGRDEADLKVPVPSRVDLGRDQCQQLNASSEKIANLKEGRMASTPTDMVETNYPDLSVSTIQATRDSNGSSVFRSQQVDSSGAKSTQGNHFSGIAKLPAASDPSSGKDENRNALLGNRGDFLSENQISNKNENSSLCRPNDEQDKMHESLIDTDGIPVFRIPPLTTETVEFGNPNTSVDYETNRMGSPRKEVPGVPMHKIAFSTSDTAGCVDITERQQPSKDDVNSSHAKSLFNQKSPEGNCGFTDSVHDKENKSNLEFPGRANREEMTLKEPEGSGPGQGSWSRGTTENGQNIQTVQLLKPQNGTLSSSKNSHDKAEGKRAFSVLMSSSQDQGCTPPKKKKLNSLGPASFDIIHSKPIKRASTPFVLFSRDIRSHVLAENPGADFAWIAKEMADRWKTLDSETKRHYQDMAKEDAERYQKEVRKIKESRGLDSTLDVSLIEGVGTKTTLDRYVAPLTPQLVKKRGKPLQEQPLVSEHPWKERKKEIGVTLEGIKEKIAKRRTSVVTDDSLRALGPLANGDGWICLKEGVVNALNFSRLQETILCRSLFQSFKLPTPDLSDPIPFNASVVGENNWALLVRLKREKIVGQNIHMVTDRRLVMNGFKVGLYPSSDNIAVMSHGEIVGLSNSVGFYGLNDLKEVLSVLVISPSASVGQTRPLKLQFWLKGEAVRMVRSSPTAPRTEDIIEKLEMWNKIRLSLVGNPQKTWEEGKCFHGKPIFTPLHSLDDLPFSQSQSDEQLPVLS